MPRSSSQERSRKSFVYTNGDKTKERARATKESPDPRDAGGMTPVPTPSWQKVPKVSGFYRRETGQGIVYRFRAPGERAWTRVPGHPTENEAKQWRNRYLGEDASTRVAPSSTRFIDVADAAINAKEDMRRSESTISGHRLVLRTYLKGLHNLKIQEIDRHVLIAKVVKPMEEGRIGRFGKPLSGSSIHNALNTASVVFEHAMDCQPRLASENPTKRIKAGEARPSRRSVKKKVILSGEQLAVLLENTEGSLKLLLAVLALAGLRLSEARNLRWEWIDFEGRRIWPNGTKNRSSRDGAVQLSKKLTPMLAAAKLRLPGEYVFPDYQGASVKNRAIERRLENLIEKIRKADPDFPAPTPHHLRHTFISHLLFATNGDIGLAASQGRHSSPAVTLSIYAHEVETARGSMRAADAIDAGLGAAL